MKLQIENKVSLVLILMAAASLISMLATLRIDSIINHDLYNYGLQFSTRWADPYWTTAGIVFSMGWLIILTSITFQLYILVNKIRKPKGQALPLAEQPPEKKEPKVEARPREEPKFEEQKTTALAVRTDDELSEFRLVLEDFAQMTPTTPPEKKDDKPTNQE